MRGLPISMWRTMFSSMTMASSTTKPTESVIAIIESMSMVKPSSFMAPNVPSSDSGTARLGITVAETLRRKKKMTPITSAIVSISVNFTSAIDSRMFVEARKSVDFDARRHRLLHHRQQRFHRIGHFNGVRARLLLNRQNHARHGC